MEYVVLYSIRREHVDREGLKGLLKMNINIEAPGFIYSLCTKNYA